MIHLLPLRVRWCLWLVSTPSDCESIFGDLEEEYLERSRSGDPAAGAWLRRQGQRSTGPLLRCCYERGEFHLLFALVACGYLFPLRLLDLVWTFVLSQVPLKAAAARGWTELAVAVTCSATLGAVSGWLLRAGYGRDARRRAAWLAMTVLPVAPLLVRVSPGAWPPWTSVLLTLSASAALFACVCVGEQNKPSGRPLSC